jgi:hypothetical protein
MSDIVERLRNDDLYDAFNADTLCNEAADEIEKLRAENANLAASNHAYLSDYQEAADEIERLRAALTEVMVWINEWEPAFIQDGEWRETKRMVRAALGEKK